MEKNLFAKINFNAKDRSTLVKNKKEKKKNL